MNRHLLNIYYVPGIVLDPRDIREVRDYLFQPITSSGKKTEPQSRLNDLSMVILPVKSKAGCFFYSFSSNSNI